MSDITKQRPAYGPSRMMQRRTLALMGLCGIAVFAVLLARLYVLQIADHQYYESLALEQQLIPRAASGRFFQYIIIVKPKYLG